MNSVYAPSSSNLERPNRFYLHGRYTRRPQKNTFPGVRRFVSLFFSFSFMARYALCVVYSERSFTSVLPIGLIWRLPNGLLHLKPNVSSVNSADFVFERLVGSYMLSPRAIFKAQDTARLRHVDYTWTHFLIVNTSARLWHRLSFFSNVLVKAGWFIFTTKLKDRD